MQHNGLSYLRKQLVRWDICMAGWKGEAGGLCYFFPHFHCQFRIYNHAFKFKFRLFIFHPLFTDSKAAEIKKSCTRQLDEAAAAPLSVFFSSAAGAKCEANKKKHVIPQYIFLCNVAFMFHCKNSVCLTLPLASYMLCLYSLWIDHPIDSSWSAVKNFKRELTSRAVDHHDCHHYPSHYHQLGS